MPVCATMLVRQAILLALVVAFCGCGERNESPASGAEANLVSDVEALRKLDRRADIDITETAAKYFPVGTGRAVAEVELNKLGFTAYSTSSESLGESWMYSKNLRRWWLGSDEIRVILTYSDAKGSRVWARLFYHSL